MKRFLAAIMAFMTICTAFLLPVEAMASQVHDPMTVRCVRYDTSKKAVKMPRLAASVTADSRKSKYNNYTYYTRGRQLYSTMRTAFAKHKSQASFRYLTGSFMTTAEIMDVVQDVVDGACSDELSVDSVDGDYARWMLSGYTVKYDFDVYKGKYYYVITMDIDYYTTDEQEDLVDAAIKKFKKTINTAIMTDYEIIKAVHDYLCKKADYDYNAIAYGNSLLFNYDYAYSAYGALVKGSCVCQGYAEAFYRMCKELGYNCRFVSSDPNEGCHAWNIIQLDGKYYFVDCTWDDEMGTDDYFLVDYSTLRSDDTESREHTLESRYATAYFKNKYASKFASSDYSKANSKKMSGCTADLSVKSKYYAGTAVTPKVIVKSRGKALASGKDYTVTYSDNKGAGVGVVNIKGRGNYSGTSARRTFIIKPARATSLAVKSGTRTAVSMTLEWNKSPGATSYAVERYDGSRWKKISNVKTAYCKVKSLSPSTGYTFRVRAYYNVYRTGYYSSGYPSIKTATEPKRVSIKSLDAGKGSFTVKWGRTTCSGYQIRYSRNKDMTDSHSVRVGSSYSSKKLTGMRHKQRYYVTIRSYKTRIVNGKKHYYYSDWSSKKSIRVK